MLSDEQITKFQMLYKNRFGEEISLEEAEKNGLRIIRLLRLVHKPSVEKEHKELQNRRKEK